MSSSRELHYYIESKANALQIPDLKTAYNALKFLGVETKGKGIKTKNDAIGLIIEQLSRGVKVPEQVKKETSRGLRKAVEEDRHSRDKLLGKYEGVNGFYRELPASYQKDLAQVFPGIQSEFETRRNQLQKSECTILVAGETASGKSSLINLLLGGVDILPTSTLGCTSTVCEIRGSKHGKKEAVGFFRSENDGTKKTKSRSPVVFDLSTDKGISQFQNEVKDSDEDGNSKYKRMEITWPFEMLEEGIVIVDTPGIGGGGNMAKYAERYLSKSYGFIYVINSANAGGVQKGRLQNFMRLVINAAGEEGYNSDSTMFVCNRWDMIPEGDREAVKEDTLKKLSKFYTDIRRSQVHYMSIHEASRALQYQTVTPEYTQLTGLVEKLLPDTLRARLNSHYRWLSAVIKRSIYSLKVSKVMAAKSMEKNKDEFIQVKKQIEKLETRSRDSISYLKTGIRQKSEDVTEMVITALQSRQIAERLFDWQPHEFPKDDKKKVGDALERIATKIAVEMNDWERKNSIVAGLKDNIIRVCKRDFELMEGQIAKIEGALLDGDTKIVQDLHKSIKKQAPVKQLWKKAKESSVEEDNSGLKGLGGAIVTVSNLKQNDKQLKKIFDGYKPRDTGKTIAKMQDATKLYLDSIFQSKKLPSKIFTFLERFAKGIDAVAKMIPDFLKADLQLMEILRESMTSTESNLKELFPKLIHSSHLLLGQLDLFYLNYIMVFDYSLDEINWDPSEGPIGSGSFADVYIADVKQAGGRKLPVALKVCKDILTENTVSDILLEDRTLRELDHPNIVRYYGATYRFRDKKKQKDMFWIMILEVCKYTLKQKFVNPDVNNPGKLIADSASQIQQMVTMADFALQLCRGLAYLHGKGIVHRDLKLENILVTDKNIVKLTDVGLAKPKTDIAFSIVGSPVYMAPEVLLQSQNYDYKADIYGLAIVLWEMWYGKDAADYIQNQLFGSLEQSIKDGLRPSLKLSTKPPESWINLIEKSWAYDPKIRPAVAAHCDFFEAFIKQSRRS